MLNGALKEGEQQTGSQHKSQIVKFAVILASYVLMYAVAVVLVAMTDHDPSSTHGTWSYFIVLVSVVSAVSGWSRQAGDTWQTRLRYLLQQLIHWGSLLFVIHLLFKPNVQHFLRPEDDGFVIIYLIGLASILGGIYLDWKMALFGLFLLFSGIVIAFLKNNALLIAIGGTATIGLLITAYAVVKLRRGTRLQVNESG